MHRNTVVAASFALGLALAAAPLRAQAVSADVVFRSGPAAGRVVVGRGYSTYEHPQVIVYRRPVARRVVVVEPVRRRHHHRHWEHRGYRAVTLYYVGGRYYDRWDDFDRGPGRAVTVYERDGRYYRECD
jgi:hypothetical protein